MEHIPKAAGRQQHKQPNAGPSQKHRDIDQEGPKKPGHGFASGGISLIVIPPNPTRTWMGCATDPFDPENASPMKCRTWALPAKSEVTVPILLRASIG